MDTVKIKEAGYYITVSSYENDGDYNADHEIYAPTLADAEIIVQILKLFYPSWLQEAPGKFGNEYGMSDSTRAEMVQAISDIIGDSGFFERMFDIYKLEPLHEDSTEDQFEQYASVVHDMLWEFKLCGMEDNQDTRCVDGIRVQHIPHTVYGYDLTEQLLN